MKYLLFPILFLFSGSLHSEEMPQKTQTILKRLSEWEAREKGLFDAKVAKKRKEVAKVLETHLHEATTKGDLDAALEIKKRIESLGVEKVIVADVEEKLADVLVASDWIREDGEEEPLVFYENETVSLKDTNQTWHIVTDEEGKEKVEILWGGGNKVHPVVFDRSLRRFTLIDNWGKPIGVYKAKKK